MMSMVPEEASLQSSSNLDERPASSLGPPSMGKEREIQTSYEPKQRQIPQTPFEKGGGPEIQTAFDQDGDEQQQQQGVKEHHHGSRSRAASALAQIKTVGAISTSADAINHGHNKNYIGGQNGSSRHHVGNGINTLPR